jgi:hypothetical protein
VKGSAVACGTPVQFAGEIRLVVHVELVDSSSEMLGVLLECDATRVVATSGGARYSAAASEVEIIVGTHYPHVEEPAAVVLLTSREPQPRQLRLRLPFSVVVTGSGEVSASLETEHLALLCDGAAPAQGDAMAARAHPFAAAPTSAPSRAGAR